MTIRNILVSVCCVGLHQSKVGAQSSQSTSVAPDPSGLIALKEPNYLAQPKYCVISFGQNSKTWMVEDGERLFVDKNQNGDLTDDGEPLTPIDMRDFAGGRDFNYSLKEIEPSKGDSPHTDFVLRRWNYGDETDSYGLSISVDGRLPIYAGWFGTFWSENRDEAPIIKLSGPFRPVMLRRNSFQLGEQNERLSIGFFRSGSTKGAESRLSIDALSESVTPTLEIEWPTRDETKPLKTTHVLDERCCYWEFYTTKFQIPKGAVSGKSKVTIRVPGDAIEGGLRTTEITIPVTDSSRKSTPESKN